MVDRVARAEGPPRSRLESWLVRKIQGGGLTLLPPYHPPGGRGGVAAEEYARNLLVGLRTSDGDRERAERFKDDGRAFRSWAEAALDHVAPLSGMLRQGFIPG